MTEYFVIEPEVGGELGPDTVLDSTVHPPHVSELHYELSGWLDDDLLESFPCYIVTDRCKTVIEMAGFTGYAFAPVKVTISNTFHELYPNRLLPVFHWLQVNGTAGEDDFALSSDYRLVVSNDALQMLKSLNLEHCDVENFA